MTRCQAVACVTVVAALAWNRPASAQTVALTVRSEAGFRRFIEMAQSGRLGDDVTNANVAISHDHVRVELVGFGGRNQEFLLTYPRTERFRYFDVAAGAGATDDDVDRVGRALDEAFAGDPFQISGVEESRDGEPIPSLTTAWARGGVPGILRAIELRMMVLTSLRYTVGVIVVLTVGLTGCLALLWAADPRRRR